MFHKRAREILNILIASDSALTGNKLANQLGVSNRTIRSDIAHINAVLEKEDIEVKSKNPQGYYIEENDKTLLWMTLDKSQEKDADYVPDTPVERLAYLMLRLLVSDNYLSMNDIADEIFVSKATINSDVRRLIQYLKEKHSRIQIQSSSTGIRYQGSELELRITITNYLNAQENGIDVTSKTFMFMKVISDSREKVVLLYQSVVNLIEQHSVYLTDKEVHSLVIYMAIALLRIKLKHPVEENSLPLAKSKLALDLASRSTQIFRIGLDQNEVKALESRLDGRRMISSKDLEQKDASINCVLDTFLEKVKEIYGFDFSHHENLRRFLYLHIKPMLHRLRNQESEENPLKDDIKKKFPLAIEISFLLQQEIKNSFQLTMNDSEISYIALHVAAALEVQYTPAKVLLVSNLGASPLQLMKTKIENHFTNKVQIIEGFTNYQLESSITKHEFPSCDLIVTTIPLNLKTRIPVVVVNPLVVREDIRNIKHYIHYYSTTIKDKDKFIQLFDPNLYIQVKKKQSYYGIIKMLVEQLYQQDIIEDPKHYYDLIIQREEAYSTIMGNRIAIPHAAENIAKKTVIGVAVLKQPIEHEGKKISLVLLNVINEHEDLQTLYAAIEKVLEIERVEPLVEVSDYQEFIEQLLYEEERK